MKRRLLVAALCALPAAARAEVAPDAGLLVGPQMCEAEIFGVGVAVHGGVTMTVEELRIGASVAGDLARFWDSDDTNGAPIDVWHVSGRLRGGTVQSPLYLLLGFGASYYSNRLDEGEKPEVPSIGRWKAVLTAGGGADLGRWGIEVNVRQPLSPTLVQQTGFSIGFQLDARIGVRL